MKSRDIGAGKILRNGEDQKDTIRPEFNRSIMIGFQGAKIEWLINRLVKVGAKVAYHSQRWQVHVASAFLSAHYYRAVFG